VCGRAQAFGRRRVVVRTLDAGADKPLRFADLGAEPNPALGRRGLRLSMAREDLLDAQLLALAQAREAVDGCDLWVMAPSKIGPVRAALRGHDLDTCREMARRALAAPTAAQARDAAHDLL